MNDGSSVCDSFLLHANEMAAVNSEEKRKEFCKILAIYFYLREIFVHYYKY